MVVSVMETVCGFDSRKGKMDYFILWQARRLVSPLNKSQEKAESGELGILTLSSHSSFGSLCLPCACAG